MIKACVFSPQDEGASRPRRRLPKHLLWVSKRRRLTKMP